ncbi:MAG TPA: glutamate 5-kinase, partial [Solirubrobacteraceae bacterium]|nr:glutamate 5-kinase [Solirubrobacteraceae bacterium]
IARDIKLLQEQDWALVWVASGAVARGKAVLGYSQERPLSIAGLQAVSAVGQGQLFGELSEVLSGFSMQAAQALLTFAEISSRESYRRVMDAFLTLLRWGVVPVVNENDSVTTEGISFGNNDFLAAQLAALLGAKRLVLITNVPGVLTDDPSQGTEGTVIRRIDNVEDLLSLGYSRIGGRAGGTGTGGVRGKLRAAQLASLGGVPTSIGSIAEDSISSHVLGTANGSEVTAGEITGGRGSSFRFWLQHATASAGTVVIDGGAANALMQRGASLLVVGVLRAEKDFVAGDAVDVCDQEGRTIAKGIVRYSSRELNLLVDARGTLKGDRPPEEVIHRDEMVLLSSSAFTLN